MILLANQTTRIFIQLFFALSYFCRGEDKSGLSAKRIAQLGSTRQTIDANLTGVE